MKKLRLLSSVLFLILGLTACSASDKHDADVHACLHFQAGYESQAQSIDAGTSVDAPTLLSETHTVYAIKLAKNAQDSYAGYVSIAATKAGDMHLYTTQSTSDLLSLVDADKTSALVSKTIDACQIYEHALHIESVGTQVIKLKNNGEKVFLLIENAEHDHEHTAHEH